MWNINYTVMMKREYFLEQNELFSKTLYILTVLLPLC